MPTPIAQLLSRTLHSTDGVSTVWDFSFSGGYLDPSHVKAYIETPSGIRTDIITGVLIGEFQLQITPALEAGNELVIYRDTPKDLPLVDFTDSSGFSEIALDTNAKQAVFIAAEAIDIVNALDVATAVLAAEAAGLSAVAAAADAVAAAASAVAAAGSAATAATQAGNASTSASQAQADRVTTAGLLADALVIYGSLAAVEAAAASSGASADAAAASAASASGSAGAASASQIAAAASQSTASAAAVTATGAAATATSSRDTAIAQAAIATSAKVDAEAAAVSALASLDSFDDRYLGAKATDPTLDNDGNALLVGALYFNSVALEVRAYTGSSWAPVIVNSKLTQLVGSLISGECFVATAGFTVDAGYDAGSSFLIYNDSASPIVMTQGAGLTLRWGPLTGNRTIDAYSFGTILCLSTTVYAVSGDGVY